MLLLTISHPSVKFDSHKSRENEFVTFLIFYMTLFDHLINRLCEFPDNRPEKEPATLSSLLVIGLAEVESFLSVTWSLDHMLKASKDLMDSGPLY